MKLCVANSEVAVHQCIGQLHRITPVDTPLHPDETKHARCRVPAGAEQFIECPACMYTFPESVIKKQFLVPTGTARSIKKLLPIIQMENPRTLMREGCNLGCIRSLHVRGELNPSDTDSETNVRPNPEMIWDDSDRESYWGLIRPMAMTILLLQGFYCLKILNKTPANGTTEWTDAS